MSDLDERRKERKDGGRKLGREGVGRERERETERKKRNFKERSINRSLNISSSNVSILAVFIPGVVGSEIKTGIRGSV